VGTLQFGYRFFRDDEDLGRRGRVGQAGEPGKAVGDAEAGGLEEGRKLVEGVGALTVDLVGAVREGEGRRGELVAGVVIGRFQHGDAVHLPGLGAALAAVEDGGVAVEEEEPALPERRADVAEEFLYVRQSPEVVQGVIGADDDVVKAAGLGVEQIAPDEADAGHAAGVPPGDAEHIRGGVHAADGVAGLRQGNGKHAGAAAEVEHAGVPDAAQREFLLDEGRVLDGEVRPAGVKDAAEGLVGCRHSPLSA